MIVVVERQWREYLELLVARGLHPVGGPTVEDLHAPPGLPGQSPEPLSVSAAAALRASATIALAAPNRVPHILGALPHLTWVQTTWAGVETMRLESLPDSLLVTRATGIFGTAMREFVLGHLLAHRLRVQERAAATSWDPTPPGLLAGELMAVAGTGAIGTAVASAAGAFSMHVRGFNRTGTKPEAFDEVVATVVELAHGADHLVSILPETPATRGIIGADVLAALKPGATFVNVGRGSAVVTTDVVEALRSGHLELAVLDVVEGEPILDGDPLWTVPGLVLTSHTAAWSRPADVADLFAANLDRFRENRPLIGLVDPDRGY